jgi:small subunit ribosomal protein S5
MTTHKESPKENKKPVHKTKPKPAEKVIAKAPLKEADVIPVVDAVVELPQGVPDELGVVKKEAWKPKTQLGRDVMSGKISSLKEVFESGRKILEAQIVDHLLPEPEVVFASVGQSRGKFGGGKRSIWKQTQKKTCEGNKPKFAIMAILGNKDGYVGVGYGSAKETMPAREKSIRGAKINLTRVRRGCGSWECHCGQCHSIPFKVSGKCGAAQITLIPAPKGTGLCVEKECQAILRMAGITDIYSKSRNKKTKYNLLMACLDALKNLSTVKINPEEKQKTKFIEGSVKDE